MHEGENQQNHYPVEGEWPVIVTHLFSLKKMGSETKNDCADEGQQQYTGLE
jgi:hypothetical protein